MERETEMEAAEALAGLAHGVPGRKRRSGDGKRRMKAVAEEEEEEERERVEVESSPIVDFPPIRPALVQGSINALHHLADKLGRDGFEQSAFQRLPDEGSIDYLLNKWTTVVKETSQYKKTPRREISSGNTGKLKMEVDDPAFPHQECVAALRNVDVEQMKTEQDSVYLDSQNQKCSMSYLLLGGGRSRHNLSEAEKEAKRIRRVLANRESARRTIRRRQALCEDLKSKVAELIEENRRLKKTKELALKENESLETTNKNLKAQIVSTVLKPAFVNTRRVHSSANGNCHEGTSNAPQLTPSITAPSSCRRDLLHEQEKLLNMAGPGTPVYMVPCPWFVTSCSEMGNVDESSADNPSSSLGSGNQVVTVKAEPPDFIVGDLNEVPIESPPLGSSSRSQFDMIRKLAKFLKPGSEEANHGNGFGLDLKCGSFDSVPVRSSHPENIQQTVLLGKKLGDAVAATEARWRRREITRLKSVNGRQR